MKKISSFAVSFSLAATLMIGATAASATIVKNAPDKPDLDLSECPRKPTGAFQQEFSGPFPQANGSYKEETYYVPESVFMLMFESDFGFAKDYTDTSGYDHPDRFALSVCSADALATIMQKRKGSAQMMSTLQILELQEQALAAKEKELQETRQSLADAQELNRRRAQPQPNALANAQRGSATAPGTQTQTASAVLPATINEDLATELDAIITRDSRSWLFNRYNKGSVFDVKVVSADTSNAEVMGNYRFNGSQVGWIRVRFTDNKVNCLTYHDFPGRCRPVGQNPAGMAALTLFAGAAMSGASNTQPAEKTRLCPPDAISCNAGYGF